MNFIRDLKNYEIACFCVMIIFALVCTMKMAAFSISGGVLNPDTILYSITALKYAGLDYYNITNPNEIFCSPIISFLTSLLFRMDLVDKSAIIIVSSVLCFLGYVGLYFLLKIRFNSLLSLIGVIIFGSTSVVIFNLSKGMIDIPAITIAIWVLYFAIISIDENPKYFLIALPLLIIGIFTKYVIGGFIIPTILLYYCMERNIIDLFDCIISDRELLKKKLMNYLKSREFKYIFIALTISIILAVLICKTLILDYGGTFGFIQQTSSTVNINSKVTLSKIFNPNKSHYFDNFSNILYGKQKFGFVLSNLLYGIISFALIIEIINIFKNFNFVKSQRKPFKTRHLEIFLMIALFIFVGVSFYGFKVMENNLISNISFIFAILIIHGILDKFPLDEKKLTLNLLFLTYFFINLIFFSLFPEKTDRYVLPLIVSFVYLVVWALENIFSFIDNGFDNNETFKNKINKDINYSNLSKIISIVLIAIFIVSTFSFIMPMEFDRSNTVYQEVLYCGFSNDLDDACDYIMQYDSDYHSKSFAAFSHSERTVRWNLNVNVTKLHIDDKELLDFNETDYLILYEDLNFKNYHKIHRCGDFFIYYHIKND